jgi:rubrerythrin
MKQQLELKELLLQAVETEAGGVEIYKTAIQCATNNDLREEWEEYLEQTQHHEDVVRELCDELGIDADEETLGRSIVKHLGESLVKAMQMALDAGDPDAAQIVATECVVLAETKDHQNWELIGEAAKKSSGEQKKVLQEGLRRGRGGGGRALLTHEGLVAGALDPGSRNAGRPAAT